MMLVSRTVEKSSMSLSSSASNSPGTLKAQNQNLGLIASAGRPAPKDSNEDAASSSQVWQSDVNPSSSAERPATTGKTQKVIDKDWPHNFEISASVVGHLEKVYSNLRQILQEISETQSRHQEKFGKSAQGSPATAESKSTSEEGRRGIWCLFRKSHVRTNKLDL